MITDQKVNKTYIGVYVLDSDKNNSVKIAVTHKPNLFRRFFTWMFLGWKWISIEELKNLK